MAYIDAKDTKVIRENLKKEFPNLKFSVRNRDHSSVEVSIVSGDIDFADSGLNLSNGYARVNEYNLPQYGILEKIFSKIFDIIKFSSDNKYFDKSDIMRDYFNTAFYYNLSVGSWRKEYKKEPSL